MLGVFIACAFFVYFHARCRWVVTSTFLVDRVFEAFGTELPVCEGRVWEIGPNPIISFCAVLWSHPFVFDDHMRMRSTSGLVFDGLHKVCPFPRFFISTTTIIEEMPKLYFEYAIDEVRSTRAG